MYTNASAEVEAEAGGAADNAGTDAPIVYADMGDGNDGRVVYADMGDDDTAGVGGDDGDGGTDGTDPINYTLVVLQEDDVNDPKKRKGNDSGVKYTDVVLGGGGPKPPPVATPRPPASSTSSNTSSGSKNNIKSKSNPKAKPAASSNVSSSSTNSKAKPTPKTRSGARAPPPSKLSIPANLATLNLQGPTSRSNGGNNPSLPTPTPAPRAISRDRKGTFDSVAPSSAKLEHLTASRPKQKQGNRRPPTRHHAKKKQPQAAGSAGAASGSTTSSSPSSTSTATTVTSASDTTLEITSVVDSDAGESAGSPTHVRKYQAYPAAPTTTTQGAAGNFKQIFAKERRLIGISKVVTCIILFIGIAMAKYCTTQLLITTSFLALVSNLSLLILYSNYGIGNMNSNQKGKGFGPNYWTIEFGVSASITMLLFIGCCTGANTVRANGSSGSAAAAFCLIGGAGRAVGFVIVAWMAVLTCGISCYGAWREANGLGNAGNPTKQPQGGGSGGGEGGETVEMMNNPLAIGQQQQQQQQQLDKTVLGPADTNGFARAPSNRSLILEGTGSTSSAATRDALAAGVALGIHSGGNGSGATATAPSARCAKCNAKVQFCMCGTKRTSQGGRIMLPTGTNGDPALICVYTGGDCNAQQTASLGPYCNSHSCPGCGGQKRYAQEVCVLCEPSITEA